MSNMVDERHFREELSILLNKYSREHGSNTPDFILAKYILAVVKAFDRAANTRDIWYEHHCSEEKKKKIREFGLSQPKPTGEEHGSEEYHPNDEKGIDTSGTG